MTTNRLLALCSVFVFSLFFTSGGFAKTFQLKFTPNNQTWTQFYYLYDKVDFDFRTLPVTIDDVYGNPNRYGSKYEAGIGFDFSVKERLPNYWIYADQNISLPQPDLSSPYNDFGCSWCDLSLSHFSETLDISGAEDWALNDPRVGVSGAGALRDHRRGIGFDFDIVRSLPAESGSDNINITFDFDALQARAFAAATESGAGNLEIVAPAVLTLRWGDDLVERGLYVDGVVTITPLPPAMLMLGAGLGLLALGRTASAHRRRAVNRASA